VASDTGRVDAQPPVLPDTAGEARTDSSPPDLPPIPFRTGALELEVQYPNRYQRLTAVDSNFVFGTIGTGDGTLEIDGVSVSVEPNGAFLAWLAVPTGARGDTVRYRLVARRDSQRVELELPVRLPYPPPMADGLLWLDAAGFERQPERWVLPGEALEFQVRGGMGLRLWIEAGGSRFPLSEGPRAPGPGAARYRVEIEARRLREAICGSSEGPGRCKPGSNELISSRTEVSAGAVSVDTLALSLISTDGRDTARTDTDVVIGWYEGPDPVNGQSGVVVGRATPFGSYRWRFPDGTRARVTGRMGDRLRLRLVDGLDAWVLAEDSDWVADASSTGAVRVHDARIEPSTDRLTLRLGVSAAPPIDIRQSGDRTLIITLYGALGDTDRIGYGERDSLLSLIEWKQLPGPRYRLTLRLKDPVWGYRATFEPGDADAYEGPRGEDHPTAGDEGASGVVLRLEVRKPPRIDAETPLRGRRIAVDPGHPGAGSHGPTGFFEGDANLAIARILVRLLREAGADPVLIRDHRDAVGLYERTQKAISEGAELFVSIHNNALPDGIRPVGREGSSTYYYHPHARDLALAVQGGLLRAMGLRDLGVLWGDLAVARMSWMPSILAEGAFMMIPSHEAALRTPEFQTRYARGVLSGLEVFLRDRAGSR
jgi:N-acetylmuramoyl-L-alanine amidase